MTANDESFPFGQPVKPFQRPDRSQKLVLVLGAYPSALHVAWRSPNGNDTIKALPVDNEPELFWTGHDQNERIEEWKTTVGFDPAIHGTAEGVAGLNGSSGVALDEHYLGPLGLSRDEAWITDCLSTYYASDGAKAAISDRFGGIEPSPKLADHPSEATIVKLATEPPRLTALQQEFDECRPDIVITLGNAAARTLQKVLATDVGPTQLRREGYGSPVELRAGSIWLPLAHPGAIRRPPWNEWHEEWKRRAQPQ